MARKKRDKDENSQEEKKEQQPAPQNYSTKKVQEKELGKLTWGRAGGVVTFLILLLIAVALVQRHCNSDGAASSTAVYLFPPGHPPVLSGYEVVASDSTSFFLDQPFYTPVTTDTLREGDILHLRVAGEGIWQQVPDQTQTAFHRTFIVGPCGPMSVLEGDDVTEEPVPAGRINAPKDLPAHYRPSDFPDQGAPMASLVAALGTVTYDPDGMAIPLKQHFLVGEERWLSIKGKPDARAAINCALNLRWREDAWKYNDGDFFIIVEVYRPVP